MGMRIVRCHPRSAVPVLLISGALGLGSACAGAGSSQPRPTPATRLAGAPALGFRPGVGLDPRERRGHPPYDGGVAGPRLPGPGSRVWQQESEREQALDAQLDVQTRDETDNAPQSPPRSTPRAAETAAPDLGPANAETPVPRMTPGVIEYRLPDRDRRRPARPGSLR